MTVGANEGSKSAQPFRTFKAITMPITIKTIQTISKDNQHLIEDNIPLKQYC